MARKPTGNPTGRPQKPIDWKIFEQLCAIQCTQEEMANFLHICDETLSDRVRGHYGEDYSTIYNRYAAPGKCSLRRNQFSMSKRNASMAIWLGKQWLGQRDMSKDETKDIAEEVLNGIREIERESGSNEVSGPLMEIKQSILDKGLTGEADKVPNELGPERAL